MDDGKRQDVGKESDEVGKAPKDRLHPRSTR